MLNFITAALIFMAISAQATVKEDLGGLYASVFKNNWNRITTKIEIIIESYEKNPDLIKTQKQLNELEKFVQLTNLNPEKAQEFLVELNAVKENLMKPELIQAAPKKMMTEAVVIPPVIPVEPVGPQPSFSSGSIFKIAGLVALMMGLLAMATVFFVRRQRKIRNEHFYPFEKKLSNEDLYYWNRVKTAFNLSPELKGPSIFSNEQLFSLEFEIGGNSNKDSLSQLKKKMLELNAELLLLTEWSVSNESVIKLVLNFPKERSAA